jgi:hypothetical protein
MPTLEMQICALQIFCDLALLPLLPYVQKSVFAPLLKAKELGNTPLRRDPFDPLPTIDDRPVTDPFLNLWLSWPP